MSLDKPVTIVLIDDRKHDAWGNCQVRAHTCLAVTYVLRPAVRADCRFENSFSVGGSLSGVCWNNGWTLTVP